MALPADIQHSSPFTAELLITVVPSRIILLFIISTHLCAFGIVCVVPGLEGTWRTVLLGMMAISAVYFLLVHNNFWPAKTIQKLYWREFGVWELVDGRGRQLPVILLDSSFSTLYFSILNFKTRRSLGNKRYSVMLLTDNSPLKIRRHLRMRMKLYVANKAE